MGRVKQSPEMFFFLAIDKHIKGEGGKKKLLVNIPNNPIVDFGLFVALLINIVRTLKQHSVFFNGYQTFVH